MTEQKRYRIYSRLGKINDEDRNSMVCLLAKAGYAVRIGKERPGNKGQTQYFVEYWEEAEK
jgi:hypothetical protein